MTARGSSRRGRKGIAEVRALNIRLRGQEPVRVGYFGLAERDGHIVVGREGLQAQACSLSAVVNKRDRNPLSHSTNPRL